MRCLVTVEAGGAASAFPEKLQQLFALFFCILLAFGFGFAYARRLHESSRAGKGVGFVPLTLKVRAARGG